ncbi:MAG: hypothetical protein A2255_06570 [Candidatus Melainabacteria bacterium RIFOXYA2_FULL_32_9]|nr:MAG: hypothetical protein A2255_06570 [Candidatus Melainabacteria bacterium RIFOXYA2_FULL_32_9]
MNINAEENNPIRLAEITSLEQFKYVVEKRIERYQDNHKGFSIFILEFCFVDSSYSLQMPILIESIANAIRHNIRDANDCYTIDTKNKFIILFGESNTNLALITINKIISEIDQQFSEYVRLDVGIAQYPQDGITYNEVVRAAAPSSLGTNKHNKSNLSHNLQLNNLHEKPNRLDINRKNKERLFNQLIYLVKHINDYDSFLSQHSAQVTIGTIIFAKELDLPWYEVEKIAVASLLHDIGYTAFPHSLFKKSEKLSSEEWKLVKVHPYIACEQVLRPLEVFDDYIPIIQDHHEYIDGSGYPKGKKGDQISLGSQIISIIDSYQAMTAEMTYRRSFDFEDVIDTYIRNAGIKWEKDLITIFTAIIADPIIRKKLAGKKEIEFENLLL